MSPVRIVVDNEAHIAEVTRQARQMACAIGFDTIQSYYIATAASELASNIFFHAGSGLFCLSVLKDRLGLELLAMDQGPGIAAIDKALQDGYSTAGSLGCGLPGAQRLMDELDIQSEPGKGTVVRGRKWL